MFHKALVPLDGSELAEGILPYVSQLSKGLGMELVLLTVVDPSNVAIPESLSGTGGDAAAGRLEKVGTGVASLAVETGERSSEGSHETGRPHATQLFDRAESEARSRLREIVARLADGGVTAQAGVAIGEPADQIVKVAQRQGCDLIAMSTHGRSALGRGIFGSIADKVIHSSILPTLTVSPERANEYGDGDATLSRVIVPLDGSSLAETALPYAAELATKLSLRLGLVRVINTGGPYTAWLDDAKFVEVLPEIKEEASEYLREVAARLAKRGLDAHSTVLEGTPAREVLDFARDTAEDMVVITSHGRSGFTRWWLGSVAETLVRASGDPVLIIPSRQSAENK